VAGVILIRPDDHLILGVRWSGFTLSTDGASTRLTAGPQGRLVLVLPPQHVGEEASPPDSPPPSQLPAGSGGASVPVWSGTLSASTRLAFAVAAGAQIPLTVEGVLGAMLDHPLLVPAGAPGPDDTAIELPWRLVIAPGGPSGAVCRHLKQPGSTDSSGLWRTRIVDPHGAGLTLRVADQAIAGATDPTKPPIPIRSPSPASRPVSTAPGSLPAAPTGRPASSTRPPGPRGSASPGTERCGRSPFSRPGRCPAPRTRTAASCSSAPRTRTAASCSSTPRPRRNGDGSADRWAAHTSRSASTGRRWPRPGTTTPCRSTTSPQRVPRRNCSSSP
jgi:hypothetical protein